MSNEIVKRKTHTGRVFVDCGNTTLIPLSLTLLIHPQLGLVQIGNGEKFNEARTLEFTNVSYTWRIDGYEITVKRTKKRKLSQDGIIKMADARKANK